MASLTSYTDIKMISFSMHGFYQSFTVVEDVMNNELPDVIALQEHWLTPNNLTKF